MIRHRIDVRTVNLSDKKTVYRAECTCGWHGKAQSNRLRALDEELRHQKETR